MNRNGYLAFGVMVAFLITAFAVVLVKSSFVSADLSSSNGYEAPVSGYGRLLSPTQRDECKPSEVGNTRCKGNNIQTCVEEGIIFKSYYWSTTQFCRETDPDHPQKCVMKTPPDNDGDGKPDGPKYAACVDAQCGGFDGQTAGNEVCN